jgi:hypothetical protein
VKAALGGTALEVLGSWAIENIDNESLKDTFFGLGKSSTMHALS